MTLQSPGLILASQSRYKQELLGRLGIEFQTAPSEVEEQHWPGETPLEMASRLAEKKARAVAEQNPGMFVLGADQVVFIDDKIYGKPGTVAAAVEQLGELQGKTHTLLSTLALVYPDGRVDTEAVYTFMTMRSFSVESLIVYVELDQPLDCAGAYKIEEHGVRLFSKMDGDDYTNIIGLPLTRVVDLFERAGLM
jgi:septum formation protein